MEFAFLGWPEDGPTLRLDYEQFSYAGKFVMSSTGKAVVRTTGDGDGRSDEGPRGAASDDEEPGDVPADADPGDGEPSAVEPDPEFSDDGQRGEIVAAIAFNEDRTDPDALWLRYVTVREDFRGEGLGPRLASAVTARAFDRGYERVRIAVNNPYAYQALWKAGFAYTGERTGIAELVLVAPRERALEGETDATLRERYRAGFEVFRERDDLSEGERTYVERRIEGTPPEPLAREGGAEGPVCQFDELAGEIDEPDDEITEAKD